MIFFEVIIKKNTENTIKNKENIIKNERNSFDYDSDDSMPQLHLNYLYNDSEDFENDSEDSYRVSELIPLSTSPAWDEISASLNIRLTGSDSLTGFCDEARFSRSHLKKTMSALLKGSTQANAALFCVKQIQCDDITDFSDLQIAFAKLLPHSLLLAEKLPELITQVQKLRTQQFTYQRLPVETQKAITDYLYWTRGSGTAAQTVPNVSSTRPRPSDTVTKSSTQASTAPNSSIARRTGQESSSTAQSPSSAGLDHLAPSQAQPLPRTSPSASQKASTASREPPKAQSTSRPSSFSTAKKNSAVSPTPKDLSNDSHPATPDPESSTAPGPSTTSQSTLGSPHPSKSSTGSQGLLDSPQHRQGPSRPKRRKKGRRK
jgi:hypothetical protein